MPWKLYDLFFRLFADDHAVNHKLNIHLSGEFVKSYLKPQIRLIYPSGKFSLSRYALVDREIKSCDRLQGPGKSGFRDETSRLRKY